MGNFNGGSEEVPIVKENEVQIVEKLMAGDDGLEYDDVRGGNLPGTRAICVKYFPRAAGMGVAVCSVCDLPIQVAFYQRTNGEYVHRKCMPPSSKDKNNNAHKEVRPRIADLREFLHEQFFVLLLNNMPVRPLKDRRPCTDSEFHLVYAKTWQLDIGTTPSLRELRGYAYTFLKGKCDPTSVEAAIANPEVSSNEFEWPKITDAACVRIVQKTVRSYGLVLIWGMDQTRDIKRFPEI
jgi:hypothetical protein